MAYCQECGANVGSEWTYCRRCGANLDAHVERARGQAEHPARARRPGGGLAIVAAIALVVAGGGVLAVTQPWAEPGSPGTGEVAVNGASGSRTTTPSQNDAVKADEAPASFAELFERTSDGVVQVDVIACDGEGGGTGFLYDAGYIGTAAHVVGNATTIALTIGSTTTTGTVVGIDSAQDLALVRPDNDLTGTPLSFTESNVRVGDPVAALGFPLGEGLTFTQGAVSAVDRTVEWPDGSTTRSLVQTDTALNPGNSGGLLLAGSGEVAGVVVIKNSEADGISYAVNSDVAQYHFDRWAASPREQPPAACDHPVGPDDSTQVPPSSGDAVATAIAQTLTNYFIGINEGDALLAWNQLSPEARQRNPFEPFSSETSTSYDFNFAIQESTYRSSDAVDLWLTFTSIQAPGYGPDGESCTRWSLDYEMRLIDRTWFIDRVTPHSGSGHAPCD